MKKPLLAICLFTLFSLALAAGAERVHVLKKGETLYGLAREYGVKYTDIIALNKIQDVTRLRVGQKIRIPGVKADTPVGSASSSPVAANPSKPEAERSWIRYRVVAGDTLYGIARRFDTTVSALCERNARSASDPLKLGERILVPAPVSAGSASPASKDAKDTPLTSPAPLVDPRPLAEKNASKGLSWPVKARAVKSLEGKLPGVLVEGTRSESILCASSGTVVSAGPYRGFGLVVIVRGDNGYLYVYGGCEALAVREGDRVLRAAPLGTLGVDKLSGRAQLYFLVYKGDKAVDPAKAPGIL